MTATTICARCFEGAPGGEGRLAGSRYCPACADAVLGVPEPRDEVLERAVRRAVQRLWPSLYATWGFNTGAALASQGYAATDNTWLGQYLHREVLNQYRKLVNEGR